MMRRILKNILALGVGVLVSLVILEVFLQLYNPLSPRVKGNTILIPANQKYIYENGRIAGLDEKIIHTKNSLGFRGDELPGDAEDHLKIIAVGGSTTECYVINDGKDWPNLVQKQLKQYIPEIWINNAGLNGHSTFGHKVLLQDHVFKLKPDYVLLMVGINEVERDDLVNTDSISLSTDLYKNRNWKGKIAGYFELTSTIFNLYYTYKAHTLQIYDAVYTPQTDTLSLSPQQTSFELQKQQKYLQAYRKRLTEIIMLCKANNVKPVLITQPSVLGGGYDSATNINYNKVKHLTRNGEVQWQVLELYNDVTRQTGSLTACYVIDLAREMPKSSAFFYDAIHFTNAGSARVAEIVAARLLPYLQKKR